MDNKHLPLVADKTTVVGLKNKGDESQTQIAVSQLPENVQFEVSLMDDMKQKQYDAYHTFNRARLALFAQQHNVQGMLNDIMNQGKETTEKQSDNK